MPYLSGLLGLGTSIGATGITEPASGTGYARVPISFNQAASGVVTNSVPALFGPASGTYGSTPWGTLTVFQVFDAYGNPSWTGTLNAPVTPVAGTQVNVPVGAISFTVTPTGNLSSAYVTATGSVTPRTLGTRAADYVNVLDYGADPTGATDSAPAFSAAVLSTASGAAVALRAPRGTYLLNSVVGTQGRLVAVLLDDGANIASGSTGYLGVTRVEGTAGAYVVRQRGGGFFGLVASGVSLTLDNTTNTYGLNANVFDERYQNTNRWAASGGSQDQHHQTIAQWLTLFDSSGWLEWKVATGPTYGEFEANTLGFVGSMQAGEWDINANTPEGGWSDVDSQGVPAAGLAVDPGGGNAPYLGGHIRYAFGTADGVTGGAPAGSLNNRWWTYPALFSSINAAPTGSGLVLTLSSSNGAGTVYGPTAVTVGGTGTLANWASAINAAAVSGVAAAVSTWGGSLARLVIYSTFPNNLGSLALASGTALAALGYTAGTYFTPRQSQYITVFGAAGITGASGLTFILNGHAITVGGAGKTADVANAVTAAGLTGITAGVTWAGKLVVEAWAGSQQSASPYWSGQVYPSLTIAGSGLATLGLASGTFYPPSPPLAFATAFSENNPLSVSGAITVNGTSVSVSGTAASVAAQIVAANIANVTAFTASGGRLVIRQTAGGTLALQDGAGWRVLDTLRVVANGALATFQPGGYAAGSFIGFFAEPDSLAPGGVGFHVGGSSYSDISVWPSVPLEARGNFQHGPRVDRANFTDNVGFRMASGAVLAFGSPGSDAQLTAPYGGPYGVIASGTAPIALTGGSVYTLTSGSSSVVPPAASTWIHVTATATLASATIFLAPIVPSVVGQSIDISTNQNITSLVFSGVVPVGAPTSMTANTGFRLRWTGTAWVHVSGA